MENQSKPRCNDSVFGLAMITSVKIPHLCVALWIVCVFSVQIRYLRADLAMLPGISHEDGTWHRIIFFKLSNAYVRGFTMPVAVAVAVAPATKKAAIQIHRGSSRYQMSRRVQTRILNEIHFVCNGKSLHEICVLAWPRIPLLAPRTPLKARALQRRHTMNLSALLRCVYRA